MSTLFLSYAGKVAIAIAGFLVVLLVRYAIASRRPQNFPPGPPPLPVIGNAHQIPLAKTFLQFHEWSQKYGRIVGFKLGPQNVVLLNDHKAVQELFDKRGSIYSDRPENYIGNELLCPGNIHILLVPYGKEWRKLRKTVQSLLNITNVDSIKPIQEAEASQALHEMLTTPRECYTSVRRFSGSTMLASVFGFRSPRSDSPKIVSLFHMLEGFFKILEPGGAPPVDAFPILKYLPSSLASYKREAAAVRREALALFSGLFYESKARQQSEIAVPCFMDRILKAQKTNDLSEGQAIYAAGILLEAGADTTASTLHSFLRAMIKHPEILKKAQQELDAVCGTHRSPNAQDIPNLPYIEAIMKETLRWRPPVPTAFPHRLTQDDTYAGYFLPKGTIFFANAWSIHRDPTEYDRPDEFIPERFVGNKFGSKLRVAGKELGEEENDNETHRRVVYTFGAGRRVCAGQHVAENSLMIAMSKIAWAFDIAADESDTSTSLLSDATDPGAYGDLIKNYSNGFAFGPNPFSASLKVRSQKHADIIEREFADAREFLRRYESKD